jgi:uracil-DNA glycosylase
MKIAKSWYEVLKDEIAKPYVSDLKKFLEEEAGREAKIFPPEDLIFHALAAVPYDGVKVVIIGQDPYHGQGQAHGLCFSVLPGVKPPPSLKNIFKELHDDLGLPIPNHGYLENWAKQGVLLLNATLTVRSGEPKSHFGKGWEFFTDAIISALAKRKDPIVFLLWGASAHAKGAQLEGTHHVVLKAAHPSPYSADGFFGCRHFSKTNELLGSWGKQPIDWRL